jgi:hypothetical protein
MAQVRNTNGAEIANSSQYALHNLTVASEESGSHIFVPPVLSIYSIIPFRNPNLFP